MNHLYTIQQEAEIEKLINELELIKKFINDPTSIFSGKIHYNTDGSILSYEVPAVNFKNEFTALMPVVEKIWSMGYFGEIYCTEDGSLGMFISHADWVNDIERLGTTLMEAIYNTVIEFIKWHNKNERN